MKKNELLKLLENINDDQEVDDLVKDSDLGKSLQSLESFKQKLKSERDFKSFLESENDKYHNKALDTWKKNNLEKELEPFIRDKYPDLITDPIQKKVMELEKQLEAERKANARKDLLNEATKYASEKKLPTSFIEKLLDEDLDKTKAIIDAFGDSYAKDLSAAVNAKIKSSNYIPGGTDPNGNKISIGASLAQQRNTTKSQINDPWSKE